MESIHAIVMKVKSETWKARGNFPEKTVSRIYALDIETDELVELTISEIKAEELNEKFQLAKPSENKWPVSEILFSISGQKVEVSDVVVSEMCELKKKN